MVRPAGAVAVLVTVIVCGLIELAIGHYRAGLTIFVIIGFFAVLTVAGLIRQRRRKRADTRG
jgi:LPXTG-motif cell wall-anchored protein